MLHASVPASAAAAALIALLRRRAVAARINDGRPGSPGLTGLAVILRVT